MKTWSLVLLVVVMAVVLTEAGRSGHASRSRHRGRSRQRHGGGDQGIESAGPHTRLQGGSDSHVDGNRARNHRGEEEVARRPSKGQEEVVDDGAGDNSAAAGDRFDRRDRHRHRHRHRRRRRRTSTTTAPVPTTPVAQPVVL